MQKNKQKSKINFPKKFFPFLFWHECKKCGKLFKWEWMWGKWFNISNGVEASSLMKICVCQYCAQTKQEAKSILRYYY